MQKEWSSRKTTQRTLGKEAKTAYFYAVPRNATRFIFQPAYQPRKPRINRVSTAYQPRKSYAVDTRFIRGLYAVYTRFIRGLYAVDTWDCVKICGFTRLTRFIFLTA